jgi:anaerobic magnesium-protoporphyrin IX monomethyl ester cyclase
MIALIAGPSKAPRSMQGLGLPYLAAVLEQTGFVVRIFDRYPPSPDTDDAATLDKRLADAIAREQPGIVGITIHTPFYAERVRLAKLLRGLLPQTLLVAGGHHPTAEPMDLLRHSDFDVCAIGEGEETLPDIAQGIIRSEGEKTSDWLGSIRGLVYKQGSQIVRTPRRPPLQDLDALPFPAHHLLGLEHYAPHPLLGIISQAIITYRGCPLRCAYCINPQGGRLRLRDPLKVVDEMERVVHQYGVRGFNFHDNLFGLRRAQAMVMCEEIARRGLDVMWDCWTAGNLIDAELAKRMRAAGCARVGFGAESGDDGILAQARRGFTTAQHRAGIHALRSAGLRVEVFFIIGLPGESEESIRRTVAFAKDCGADEICLSLHRPYPGTAVWRNPRAFGVRITRGPNYEAYIETEGLSRAAMLACVAEANEELRRCGLTKGDSLRCDRYGWE